MVDQSAANINSIAAVYGRKGYSEEQNLSRALPS